MAITGRDLLGVEINGRCRMSKKDDELERLKRIREQQIRARDPRAKEKKFHGTVSGKYRRKRKQVTFRGALKDELASIPHKWRGLLIGTTLGVVVLIVLLVTVESAWTPIIGVLIIVLLAIVGFSIGSSFDWRDKMRDF